MCCGMLKHTGPHLQSWALTRDANMSAGKVSVHLKVIVHLFVSVPVHSAFSPHHSLGCSCFPLDLLRCDALLDQITQLRLFQCKTEGGPLLWCCHCTSRDTALFFSRASCWDLSPVGRQEETFLVCVCSWGASAPHIACS